MERMYAFFRRQPLPRMWQVCTIVGAGLIILFIGWFHGATAQLSELGIQRISGWPGGRDYLVVFQNDAERRATGGFITSYAELSFRFGIPFFSFGNVYDPRLIQPDTLPQDPLIAELLAGTTYPGHGFRDGNLDTDWPTSARELLRLFRLGYPDTDFDGVIAVNTQAVANLIDDLGGVGDATGDNLFHLLEYAVQDIDAHNPDEVRERKSVLSDIAGGVMKRLLLHPSRFDDAIASLVYSLQGKHVLLYFADETLATRAHELGWDGALPTAYTGDVLGVFEGNYGGLKSSRYLERDTSYDVSFVRDDTGMLRGVADLRVALTHRGYYAEPIAGWYKSMWRVYSPRGSELVPGGTPVARSFDDGRYQVYDFLVDMQPGESRELALQYQLPADIVVDQSYSLQLIRQPGGPGDPVDVSLQLPQGMRFANMSDCTTCLDAREHMAWYRDVLTQDTALTVRVLPDTQAPRVSWQTFVGGLGTVELRFAEPLDPNSVEQATISLADANYRNDETDNITVSNIRFLAPQTVRFDVAGVSPVCREWYDLTLAGIADIAGNMLDNRQLTLVQWLTPTGENCDPDNQL